MPCKEYLNLESQYKMEMSQRAQYTYRENEHLRGGVSDRKAKQIAKEAQGTAAKLSNAMHWHRESCAECQPHWVNVCEREPELNKEVQVLLIRLGTEIDYATATLTERGWMFSAEPLAGQIVAWLEADYFLTDEAIRKVPKDNIRAA